MSNEWFEPHSVKRVSGTLPRRQCDHARWVCGCRKGLDSLRSKSSLKKSLSYTSSGTCLALILHDSPGWGHAVLDATACCRRALCAFSRGRWLCRTRMPCSDASKRVQSAIGWHRLLVRRQMAWLVPMDCVLCLPTYLRRTRMLRLHISFTCMCEGGWRM